MVIDFVINHWNNLLTITAFLLAAITGYYQVRDYRAQQPEIKILSLDNPTYYATKIDDYDDKTQTEDYEDHESIEDTYYSVDILLENDGRNPATISDFSVELSSSELELYNERTTRYRGWRQKPIKLNANDRRKINLFTSGEIRDQYEDEIQGILKLDTTTGVIEREVIFKKD